MIKKMNMCLFIALAMSIVYGAYVITYVFRGLFSSSYETSNVIFLLPHILFFILAIVFNAIALLTCRYGFALASGIMYSITIVLVIVTPFFLGLIVQMILTYVGYAQLSNGNRQGEVEDID